ncbi:hypothetical protein J4E93_010567 [Alternaria ventricosa]|uniref:uncharacterized protein n=1 Tax=Alternaria ventricosa TaxID=1187951 RepID=UPI0020C5756B|nr:uncharacterized protein J4E93_010567 [Alternaria ventricosa]KAI4637167.1 hypothetical protein J4E93_010567 [Alternaria ventricosa]
MPPKKNAGLQRHTADIDVTAVPARRQRGRPRKIMEDAHVASPSSHLPKRRGRPPKVRSFEQSPAAVPAVPKKHDRPQEKAQDDSSIILLGYSRPPNPQMQPAESAPEKHSRGLPVIPAPAIPKKRGRPPKVAPESEASQADSTPLIPRKRGRPRKAITEKEAAAPAIAIAAIPKKRDRPPNVARVEELGITAAVPVSIGAKKRGRPQKLVPAGEQPPPVVLARKRGRPPKVPMQTEQPGDPIQDLDPVAGEPTDKGAVSSMIIADPFSDSEDGQPAKRRRMHHRQRPGVVEPDPEDERPSWGTRFVYELGEHAKISDQRGSPSRKETNTGGDEVQADVEVDEDLVMGEDPIVNIPGGIRAGFEDSEDETYHTPKSSGVNPRHYHEDSVVSFFDPDVVNDGSSQAVIYEDVDMGAIDVAEQDVDGMRLAEEAGKLSQEEVVNPRGARRDHWPNKIECEKRPISTPQRSREIPETQEEQISPRNIHQLAEVSQTVPDTARTAQTATTSVQANSMPSQTLVNDIDRQTAFLSVPTAPLHPVYLRSPQYLQIAVPDIDAAAHRGTLIGPLVVQHDESRYRITVHVVREKRPDIA